jgi:hypothetical protein
MTLDALFLSSRISRHQNHGHHRQRPSYNPFCLVFVPDDSIVMLWLEINDNFFFSYVKGRKIEKNAVSGDDYITTA